MAGLLAMDGENLELNRGGSQFFFWGRFRYLISKVGSLLPTSSSAFACPVSRKRRARACSDLKHIQTIAEFHFSSSFGIRIRFIRHQLLCKLATQEKQLKMASKPSKEDKDALDTLEAEAKEFDKVRMRLTLDSSTPAYQLSLGCGD
jgi:hypothetical protein